MIEQLTPRQKLKLGEYKDKYIQIGLNTDRINRKEAEQDINDLYTKILKRKKPKKIFFCKSLYQLWHMLCLYKYLIFKLKNKKFNKNEVENEVWNEVSNEVENEVRNEVRNEVSNEVSNEVRNEVENEVWNEVRNEVSNEVENEVRNEVSNEVSNEVRNEVWNEVENEVWNEVRNEVRNEVWKKKHLLKFVWPYLYGNFDSYYFAFYSFFFNECNIKCKCLDKYLIYERLCKVSFIYPLKDVCFVSEKPIEIHRENKKLHCTHDMALKYSDGFGLYSLHGVRFDKKLWESIVNKKITPKEMLSIENIEQRYAALKTIGLNYVFDHIPHKLICPKTEMGNELYELDFDGNKVKCLKYSCPSTGRVYTKFVPDEFIDADSAQAWSFQINITEYLNIKAQS